MKKCTLILMLLVFTTLAFAQTEESEVVSKKTEIYLLTPLLKINDARELETNIIKTTTDGNTTFEYLIYVGKENPISTKLGESQLATAKIGLKDLLRQSEIDTKSKGANLISNEIKLGSLTIGYTIFKNGNNRPIWIFSNSKKGKFSVVLKEEAMLRTFGEALIVIEQLKE
jgi:hypothetical protein